MGISIGQEVLITTYSAIGVVQIVWLPKCTQQFISTLVQDDTAEIQHRDWLVGLQIS